MKKLLLPFFTLFFFISNAQEPFITTWEVTAGDLDILIPTNTDDYTYNYTVDFGDGTILTNQTGNVTHNYASPGVYTVSISGVFPHFNGVELNDPNGANLYNEKMMTVEQWGDNVWLDMTRSFWFCINLIITAPDTPVLSQVDQMVQMFANAESFNQSIENWDVSNVNNMSNMFQGCQAFNQPLNNWDVSNVSSMGGMFVGASSFNQPLENWDVSNVTTMYQMFLSATLFDQPLNNWNVSNVTSMWSMFRNTESFNQPLNNWDVSNVTDMFFMFNLANSFNQNINNWNVSNVANMSGMFSETVSFNQPLNNWNISNVNNMIGMFKNAFVFDQPLDNWDISNVNFMSTSTNGFFEGAISFNQNLSNWDFNIISLPNFINNSGMSSENYDLLINNLASLGLNNGTLGATNIEYCDEFTRQQLIDSGWSITDGGIGTGCDLNYVSGFVLYDEANNGCDLSDFNLSNYLVNVNNGSEDASFAIDDDGQYEIGLDTGNYTLNILNLDSNFTSNPPSHNINFTGQNEIIEDIDFCITANQQFEDLAIDIFPLDDAIPGFETDYQIIATNNGTQTVPNYQVTFSFDEMSQSFVSSTETGAEDIAPIITFDFTNLEPFSSRIFEITMLNVVPPMLNSGDILTFTVQVSPDTNDTTPDDNTAIIEQTVVNSFDPNDKMVVQGDEIDVEDIDQYLDYRIRFQNLGTANALNVKITDTIESNLDWRTFQPISSSHDFRIEIVDGEQINYYFDNINLPFEAADEEGSNGYITYKIKPKPTVQIGDTFENTAYIYFDFNLPIITNTAVTTVVDNLSINTFDFSQIKIYPNPVKNNLNIELPSGLFINSIALYNIQGKRIRIFKNQNELDFSTVQKGFYILKLDTDKGMYNHKVIKE
jgi:uncharacterized repeat protein (TIGR01451 family)